MGLIDRWDDADAHDLFSQSFSGLKCRVVYMRWNFWSYKLFARIGASQSHRYTLKPWYGKPRLIIPPTRPGVMNEDFPLSTAKSSGLKEITIFHTNDKSTLHPIYYVIVY